MTKSKTNPKLQLQRYSAHDSQPEWRGVSVLPRTRLVLETGLHKLVPSALESLTSVAKKEIQRAESVIALPAHAISTKNKHLLLSCDTNPRFHGGSFGV